MQKQSTGSLRPTSPHLSIYRPQISTVISILHRITGVALYVGTFLLVAFLVVVAYFPEHYAALHECLSSAVGRVFLFGWTVAFFLHFFNGIRHLFWDIGKGFEIPCVNRSGWAVIIFTIIFSLATWLLAYHNAGIISL